ncbi:MAG: hypothetical protein HOI53_00380 [Francisellaceae bacterium]|jgi:hypothetical protein|nr:hypothetical protein [Francisellaceae bacterium]MBT6206455.1 hypothetical protein [Francisellaceae bacterium]MBT6537888.1 hypothetical protein [Francisellaceae bacterium]
MYYQTIQFSDLTKSKLQSSDINLLINHLRNAPHHPSVIRITKNLISTEQLEELLTIAEQKGIYICFAPKQLRNIEQELSEDEAEEITLSRIFKEAATSVRERILETAQNF